jgi:hypothetical protein
MAPPSSPIFQFGKHKGRTHEWVAKSEPSYIVWAYENIAFHASINKQLYLACADEVDERDEYFEDDFDRGDK